MKGAADLKVMYDKFKHIDAKMCGAEKTDWRDVWESLFALESKIKDVKIRHDENCIFCEWIKRKLLEDVRNERIRIEDSYGKQIFQ